jgi:NADH-quinone oxidoreductase subunit M
MNSAPLLSITIWLPALGSLAVLASPRENIVALRSVSLGVSLLALATALGAAFLFDPARAGFQLVESVAWVPSWGISYTISVDGISLWLVLLTAFLTPVALVASWGTIERQERAFHALVLLLASGLFGVFTAQDMLLFYIFFEFTLIPTALLIGIWGGAERRSAAIKFFAYTFSGSVFLLLGIIGLYLLHGQSTGVYTFDTATILASLQLGTLRLDAGAERLLFGLFFIGFAVKAPIWPFHTWMTTAHAEAPSSGVVDVIGLLIKIGAYGLIRYNVQLFPATAAWAAPAVGVLAVIGILYAAWIAYQQTDMKRLLAYASVSHLGLIVLGVFALNAQGIAGAVAHMINSALTTGALFLVVGMLAARRGSRELKAFGGLWKVTPWLGSLTLLLALGSIGLPGLNGFVSEFTVLQGSWRSPGLGWRYTLPAILGVVLAAVYLLHMYRTAFMGDTPPELAQAPDVRPRELVLLVILAAPVVVFGLYPNLLFGPMQQSVTQIAQGTLPFLASR